jgi:uncharacterized membrane protein affecting hemolysin expression
MPSLNRSRFASPAVVVVLLSILVALMYLQYQWTKQVSDVARAHVPVPGLTQSLQEQHHRSLDVRLHNRSERALSRLVHGRLRNLK